MERKTIIRKVFTTPDWKEVARPRVSSASNHFLIDTNREPVNGARAPRRRGRGAPRP
jgi:hypothetical protein